jgi:hypothetical protein
MALKDTLTKDAGPLPIWAWASIFTLLVLGFLLYEKKKNMTAAANAASNQATSSNLGTTPVSNLTVSAEPMPIQMGDTFVNVPPSTTTATATNTVNNPPPPSGTLPPAPTPTPTPTPTTPTAQSQAERSSYDAALQAYQAANSGGASQSVLQKLMAQVIATQAVYTGKAGSTAAHTAYDNALKAAQASPGNASLFQQLIYAQAAYTGKVPSNA